MELMKGAGGVGDDKCVPSVGFALAGVQIGKSAHRQPWQVGDLTRRGPRRRAAHRSRPVDRPPPAPAPLSKRGEQLPQVWFSVRQLLVVQPFPGWVQCGGVVFSLTDIQTAEHGDIAGGYRHGSSGIDPSWTCHGTSRQHPRYADLTRRWSGLSQWSTSATRPGDTTFSIMIDKGLKSYRDLEASSPTSGTTKKVTGDP
jgi:hypothetical protein